MAANRFGIRDDAFRHAGMATDDSDFLTDCPGRVARNTYLSELPRR